MRKIGGEPGTRSMSTSFPGSLFFLPPRDPGNEVDLLWRYIRSLLLRHLVGVSKTIEQFIRIKRREHGQYREKNKKRANVMELLIYCSRGRS